MEFDGGIYKERTASGIALRAGLTTLIHLGGGLLLGFGVAFAVSSVPLHISEPVKNVFAALVMLVILVLASLRWGRKMAELGRLEDRPRAARIGGLSFAVALVVTALILPAGEIVLGRGVPTHVIYGVLFVPAAFLIVAATATAWGRVLRDWSLAGSLALRSAVPSSLAFLLVYLLMDVIGYRAGLGIARGDGWAEALDPTALQA